MKRQNIGSSFDSWLQEEGILEDTTAIGVKRFGAAGDTCAAPAKDVPPSYLHPVERRMEEALRTIREEGVESLLGPTDDPVPS